MSGITRSPAGHMAVVDGENGRMGVGQIVDDGLAVGAEHFRDAFGNAVQSGEGFFTVHGCHLFRKRGQGVRYSSEKQKNCPSPNGRAVKRLGKRLQEGEDQGEDHEDQCHPFGPLGQLCVSGLAALAFKCKKRLPALVSLAAVLAAWVGYGYFSMSRFERICESSPQITAAVAQDEVEGSKKQSCSAWDCARSYKRIITAAEITSADIVVLPETAVPMGYDENADEFRLVSSLARG